MNWGDRIKLAMDHYGFSDDDKYEAGYWPSCAVGERSKKLSGKVFIPDSGSKAYDLGDEFYDAVYDDRIDKAKELYDQITQLTDKDFESRE